MKIIGWAVVAYLGLTAVANFSPGTLGVTVTSLPDIGYTVTSQTGTTAALIDLAAAGAVWYFLV